MPVRFEQGSIVKDYAGDVEYRMDGWLEKNKDTLNDNLTHVLAVFDKPNEPAESHAAAICVMSYPIPSVSTPELNRYELKTSE